ncbi:formin-like protein 6 [Actinidia eriantha]|uniref:formin-like protein 6 n=1 Tax=Actinidia eriantha TaxID=165200 RepID=UPI00258643F1|nr:formin-like protein 6 [Actinidia eriantha]
MKRKSSFQELNQDHDLQQLDESSQSSSRPRLPPQQPVSQPPTIPGGAAEHPLLSTAPWPYYQQYQLTQPPSAYYIPVPPPQSRMPGGSAAPPPSSNPPTNQHQPPWPDNLSLLEELNKEAMNAKLTPSPPLSPPPHPPPSPPPYPWATKEVGNHRAGVRSLHDLRSNGITMISGRVICRFCNTQTTIKYNVLQRFSLLKTFIRRNKNTMTELREAPEAWKNPEEKLRRCMERDRGCGQNNALIPYNAVPPRSMNWLFMLLGQTLGLCTTDDLQYLVNERSDNKPRLLYLAFLSLCKQLKPDEPNFDP